MSEIGTTPPQPPSNPSLLSPIQRAELRRILPLLIPVLIGAGLFFFSPLFSPWKYQFYEVGDTYYYALKVLPWRYGGWYLFPLLAGMALGFAGLIYWFIQQRGGWGLYGLSVLLLFVFCFLVGMLATPRLGATTPLGTLAHEGDIYHVSSGPSAYDLLQLWQCPARGQRCTVINRWKLWEVEENVQWRIGPARPPALVIDDTTGEVVVRLPDGELLP